MLVCEARDNVIICSTIYWYHRGREEIPGFWTKTVNMSPPPFNIWVLLINDDKGDLSFIYIVLILVIRIIIV